MCAKCMMHSEYTIHCTRVKWVKLSGASCSVVGQISYSFTPVSLSLFLVLSHAIFTPPYIKSMKIFNMENRWTTHNSRSIHVNSTFSWDVFKKPQHVVRSSFRRILIIYVSACCCWCIISFFSFLFSLCFISCLSIALFVVTFELHFIFSSK